MLRSVAVVALLGGCGFHPGLAGDGSLGSDDAGTGSALPDGALGSDGGIVPIVRCGTPGAVRDDFATAATAGTGQWFVFGTPVVSGGVLSVTPNSATAFAGYYAKHSIDLTAANVTVQVPQMISTTANATAGMYLFDDLTHYLAVYQQLGMLVAEYANGGAATNQKIAYDSTQLWWRIAEANGQILFQWSSDNATWTAFGPPLATPSFATRTNIALGGLSFDNQAHGTVRYDSLNLAADPAPWCKAGTFHDGFARTTIGFDWSRRLNPTNGNGCTPTVNSGAHFDQNGTQNSRCWLVTQAAFDASESSAMIYVPTITASRAGWSVFLRGVTDDLDAIYLQYQDPAMLCARVNSTPPVCKPYDPSYVYLRIREAGGQLSFEASADAMAWASIAQVATPFSLARTQFEIGTATTNGFSGTLPQTISAYNAPP